tara:strand:- start:51 stop:1895 length:1845 start_codon:yes stop_codon:yes gene_type:complete
MGKSENIRVDYEWWERGIETGRVGRYEREMVRVLEKEFGTLPESSRLTALFTSLFFKAGHTTLPLDKTPAEWLTILGSLTDEIWELPDEKIDISELKKSRIAGSVDELTPFTIDGDNFSFRKNRVMENALLQWFMEKSNKSYNTDISDYISKIFPKSDADEVDWQKIAVVMSMLKPFLIISGGPGTGKTTTVAKILVLNQMISDRPLRIALAAPTGKAAGRMGEALQIELEKLNPFLADLKLNLSQIPSESMTVHRLLSGTKTRGLLPPVERNYLTHDLIIIDEASMMDLQLMSRLTRHISDSTKLILLGDKDQLASVEAGSVFADLCQKPENGFRSDTIQLLNEAGLNENLPAKEQSGLNDAIVYLTKSYRFGRESGIGQLAEFVKRGDQNSEDILKLFTEFTDIHHHNFAFDKEEIDKILKGLQSGVKTVLKLQSAEEILNFWKKSVWLTPLRSGLTGTDRLNRLLEQVLHSDRTIYTDGDWYHGRPVIITENDYNLGIFNGDMGVCVKDKEGKHWLYVESGSELKRFNINRTSKLEPSYFLTVHKSQGSEFDRVNLLLPRADHSLLTRELIYTAVTRAKSEFNLYGDMEIFLSGISRKTQRYTGLKEKVAR